MYIIFYILCIISVLSSVFVVNVLHSNKSSMDWIILTISSQIIDFTLSVTLITLYIKKLFLLNIDIQRSAISKSNNKILNAVSKMSILSSFAIISTQIGFLF